MSRLDEVYRKHPLRAWRTVAWTLMLLIACFLVWVQYAVLDEVAETVGEVVPQDKVKVIQHLEGGIIEEIFVREGDTVDLGTPLVRLDLPTTAVNRQELLARLDGLNLARARLIAEGEGEEPTFPANEMERHPDLVAVELNVFRSRSEQRDSRISVLRSQLRQRELDLKELRARQRAIDANLALVREKLLLSERLMEHKLTPKLEHIQLQREVQALEGELAVIAPAIPRAQSAIDEAVERIREETVAFKNRALQELSQMEREIAELMERLSEATDQAQRTTIRSPIKGVVKNLRYHTIGGVVRSGDAIMEVVPLNDKLVLETRLDPSDRGYIRVGQPALIKVTAYDFFQYGGLEGQVIRIAADANRTPDGAAYFNVIIETDKSYVDGMGEPLPITPGMQATADIRTGTRTVLRYLVKPLLRLKHEGFRER